MLVRTKKIGDKVKIRDNMRMGDKYGGAFYINSMTRYKGKEATVVAFDSKKIGYKLDVDGECWTWTEEMLEDVNKIGGLEDMMNEKEVQGMLGIPMCVGDEITIKSEEYTLVIKDPRVELYLTIKGIDVKGWAVRRENDEFDIQTALNICLIRANLDYETKMKEKAMEIIQIKMADEIAIAELKYNPIINSLQAQLKQFK